MAHVTTIPPHAGGTDTRPSIIPTVDLMGLDLCRNTRREVLDRIFRRMARGRGGWVVTPNLDFLRRFVRDPGMRDLYASADVSVADGMPLVWASRLQGHPVPERIAGSSLVWDLAERAADAGRSLYLLGGAPGTAESAAAELQRQWPSLKITGAESPMFDAPPSDGQVRGVLSRLEADPPDLILVALGSPKQEWLMRALRPHLPHTWMVGVGVSFSFVTGEIRRAPTWMQKAGLEWLHRLVQEPHRLARRYLLQDAPFAVRLFGRALVRRLRLPG